jgi:hypothetical protein
LTFRYEYEFPQGILDENDDVLKCEECDGEGGWDELLPARITDLEPTYRFNPCEECEDGYHRVVECVYCGAEIDTDVMGLGAVEVSISQLGRFCRPLCGPCGWAEVVADD